MFARLCSGTSPAAPRRNLLQGWRRYLRVTEQAQRGFYIHWSAAPSVNAYLTAHLLAFLCTAPLDRSDADRERKASRGERSKNPNG